MSTPNSFVEKYATHHEISYQKAEDEIVSACYEISNIIAPKFVFAFHSREDLVQEGVYEAFKAFMAGDYDMTRPLRPFLRAHIHNRLFNFKRDNFYRMEIPCRCCEIDTATPCLKYSKWLRKNSLKKGIASPASLDFDPMGNSPSPNLSEDADLAELKEIIPDELRPSLLKVLNGQSITSASKARLGAYLADRFEEDE